MSPVDVFARGDRRPVVEGRHRAQPITRAIRTAASGLRVRPPMSPRDG